MFASCVFLREGQTQTESDEVHAFGTPLLSWFRFYNTPNSFVEKLLLAHVCQEQSTEVLIRDVLIQILLFVFLLVLQS